MLFIPDAHTLLMVVQGTEFGIPEAKTACLVGAWPIPADTTFPRYASSMEPGSIFARSIEAEIATEASSGPRNDAKEPWKVAMGVLA